MKIAIIGKMCSGKSFVANHIMKRYNLKKYSFASKLKQIAKELFGMKQKDRRLLQIIADKMKEIDPDVWVNYLISEIKTQDNIVIDDVRYPNECVALAKLDFIFIRLKVSKTVQQKRLIETYGIVDSKKHIQRMSHDSENDTQIMKFADIELDSNDTLQQNVSMILDKMET